MTKEARSPGGASPNLSRGHARQSHSISQATTSYRTALEKRETRKSLEQCVVLPALSNVDILYVNHADGDQFLTLSLAWSISRAIECKAKGAKTLDDPGFHGLIFVIRTAQSFSRMAISKRQPMRHRSRCVEQHMYSLPCLFRILPRKRGRRTPGYPPGNMLDCPFRHLRGTKAVTCPVVIRCGAFLERIILHWL